ETSPSGYAGDSFLRWDGPNLFHTPGSDIFGFDFEIQEAGRYHFRIRNRHDHPDSTEANDVWVRMDGGPWIKVFSWQRGTWTWATQHEFSHDDKPLAEYTLTSGSHRIEFSGRSHDFMIDRFHLYRDHVSNPLSTGHPESDRVQRNDAPISAFHPSVFALPEDDSQQTTVVLDARRSVDPDGDPLYYQWDLRGVRFADGTHRSSPVVSITFPGGFALPLKLKVSDGERTDVSYQFVNVEDSGAVVGGEGAVWHPVHVDFAGPTTHEGATAPNPFLDRRLQVTFTAPNGESTVVPGFFAGDGKGGGTGNVWRARFTPDQPGVWTYEASFRIGEGIAIDLSETAGQPSHFDGATGRFGVLPRDPEAPGLLAEGRLEYVGEHYLKARHGDWFVKTGTNSPENFMAYAGFDDVQDNGGVGIIHRYEPHVRDWRPGDPYFESASTGVSSKGIVGALNYLGEQGVNALYFLPMNLGGDGQDTTPFLGYQNNAFDKRHYDISRLHQWNQVLDHAQRQGILLHFVLAETEAPNENWLDNGTLGLERKLFFRELSARFGYVNGLKWNLSEENDYPVQTLRDMAAYLRAVDPYDHAISVHTHPNDLSDYHQLVGDPNFDAASIQYSTTSADGASGTVRNMSIEAGRKWLVDMDENGTWNVGLSGSNAGQMRCEVLYDVLFNNGGIEWYAGYHPLPLGGDVRLEDFRTREEMWRYSRIAREFLETHFDVASTHPTDGRVLSGAAGFGGAEALLWPHERMAVYLPDVQEDLRVDLQTLSGPCRVRWFDPRTGEELTETSEVTGGGVADLPIVPSDRSHDWLVLIEEL
ncbi:MAG: DUF5060 domain-containing protein, partial [Planctomycetota bacterium]